MGSYPGLSVSGFKTILLWRQELSERAVWIHVRSMTTHSQACLGETILISPWGFHVSTR